VGKFCASVSHQIFSRHQFGVVIVAGLDALKPKNKQTTTFSW